MIEKADIEGSESNVAVNSWLPQASYPYGNFSDTFCLKLQVQNDFDRNVLLTSVFVLKIEIK